VLVSPAIKDKTYGGSDVDDDNITVMMLIIIIIIIMKHMPKSVERSQGFEIWSVFLREE